MLLLSDGHVMVATLSMSVINVIKISELLINAVVVTRYSF